MSNSIQDLESLANCGLTPKRDSFIPYHGHLQVTENVGSNRQGENADGEKDCRYRSGVISRLPVQDAVAPWTSSFCLDSKYSSGKKLTQPVREEMAVAALFVD